MKKKILITGGAGFIGLNLLRKLSEICNVTVYDNLSRGKMDYYFSKEIKKKNVNFVKVDLNKRINLKNDFDYIFHLAATVGVKNVVRSPLYTIENNIKSLFNIIDFCKKKQKTKFIFFSTSEVYSPLIEKKIKNLFPLREDLELFLKKKNIPRDSYYLSKLFSEKILEISNINYIIYRPHNIYGPRMGKSHVIPELIKKISKQKKKIIVYSPKHKRVFCYIDDCINQIISTCFRKKFLNKIVNLGSKQREIKIFDLAKLIKNLLNSKKKLYYGKITPGSPMRRIPSLKKTFNERRKYKELSLEAGLKRTISWYLND